MAGSSRWVQQVEAGAAEEVGPSHQLVRQRGHEPAPVPLEPGEQAPHGSAADLNAEVGGRHVLEVVGLVEHQPLVRRQHRRFLPVVLGLTHREVRRQQMVVHDHDVGLRRTAAGPEQEALVEVAALEAGAEVRLSAHLVPHFTGGRDRQVAQGAVGGVSRPLRDPHQLVELVRLEQRPLRGDGLVEPSEAEVVPPALEQREGRRVVLGAKRPAKERAGPCRPAAPAG